jgi:hypothetical protein
MKALLIATFFFGFCALSFAQEVQPAPRSLKQTPEPVSVSAPENHVAPAENAKGKERLEYLLEHGTIEEIENALVELDTQIHSRKKKVEAVRNDPSLAPDGAEAYIAGEEKRIAKMVDAKHKLTARLNELK